MTPWFPRQGGILGGTDGISMHQLISAREVAATQWGLIDRTAVPASALYASMRTRAVFALRGLAPYATPRSLALSSQTPKSGSISAPLDNTHPS